MQIAYCFFFFRKQIESKEIEICLIKKSIIKMHIPVHICMKNPMSSYKCSTEISNISLISV